MGEFNLVNYYKGYPDMYFESSPNLKTKSTNSWWLVKKGVFSPFQADVGQTGCRFRLGIPSVKTPGGDWFRPGVVGGWKGQVE